MILEKTLEYNRRITVEMTTDDNMKQDNDKNGSDSEVVVCDGIELSEAELDLLSLGPGFMVVSGLNMQEMKVESCATLTKIRWGRRKIGTEEMTGIQEDREVSEMNVKDLELAEALELETRDVLSENCDTIDMRNKMATDMKGNRRVMMPGPSLPIVEAEFNTRMGMWQKVFKDYMNVHCDEDGQQHSTNLSKRGLKKVIYCVF